MTCTHPSAEKRLLESPNRVAEQQDPYVRARLVLEYLRAFAWPLVVLVILALYGPDLVGLVSEREFEAFGVRFGPRIAEVQEQVEAELADVRDLLERQRNAPEAEREQIAEDLAVKVRNLEENVTRAVDDIRQSADQAQTATGRQARPPIPAEITTSRRTDAQRLEAEGFDALIARDAEQALSVLDEAHRLWPDYHNVAEIRTLLRTAGGRLNDPNSPAWKDVYRSILTDYSWGMSKEHRAALRAELY